MSKKENASQHSGSINGTKHYHEISHTNSTDSGGYKNIFWFHANEVASIAILYIY